jgi:dipeptidyl aminopeptidase/acylaminoacyl peptidase
MKFSTQTIRFPSGPLTLTGDLMIPKGDSHSGAVFIHGSGTSTRHNPWYREIAEYLATHGITVLLPDKRGCNESEGNWRTAHFYDLAEDAIAGVKALSTQTQIDPQAVGLIGISQGGWIAPIAAHQQPLSYIVSISGATVCPREQHHHEIRNDLRRKGLPLGLIHLYAPIAQFLLSRRWPSWKHIKNFDPLPLWKTLPTPGLLIFGEADEYENVPVKESLHRLEPLIKHKGPPELNVQLYLGSGHGLKDPKTNHIRHDFLNFLTDWITQH